MKVIKVTPRGYCYGVVDAMVIARNAAKDPSLPRPIYILGMIVHNKHVTDAFEEEGIITLDGPSRLDILDKIEEGTVIFTAHGVSPEVKSRAIKKGLTTIDATCPDVTKTHDLIKDRMAEGYEFIYIGKKGHPEPEGAVGIAPEIVHLIQNKSDIDELNIKTDKIIITNQTTMSQWDVVDLIQYSIKKYPTAHVHKEICMATQVRQEAIAEQAVQADLTIVVGDPMSNNSNRLAQVSHEIAGTKAYRISDISEIQLKWLEGIETVAVTSGASTPTPITREVVSFLEKYDPNDESTWNIQSYVELSRILPKVRIKD